MPKQGVKALAFTGHWTLETMPEYDVEALVPQNGEIRFDAEEATATDTSLAMTITTLADHADANGVRMDLSAVPDQIAKLVLLARAVPEQEAQPPETPNFVTRAGRKSVELAESAKIALTFCGETMIATLRTLRHPKTFRLREFIILLGDTGFRALPIVGLLAFLTGLILAFVGAVQLRVFGADVYVADLVGLAMSREMAALMTSMIMSGRSGAAFAAHLGTMRVSEEIDALTTFGFQPVDMLALPRVIALTLMMPLLTLYANLLGYFGGAVIGTFVGICLLLLVPGVGEEGVLPRMEDGEMIAVSLSPGLNGWLILAAGVAFALAIVAWLASVLSVRLALRRLP